MISFDECQQTTMPSHPQRVSMTHNAWITVTVCTAMAATIEIDYCAPPTIQNVGCCYEARPIRLLAEPAPNILDEWIWREAEEESRRRCPPRRQQVTLLDRELRTKTRNRRFK